MVAIGGKTRVVGILGCPVSHTMSPVMQNAAFEASGIDMVYLPFNVFPSELASAIAGIRALGLKGVNVTIPHKQAVIPLLDEVSEVARLIGAVNTIVNVEGRLIGYNTDCTGFITSLREEGNEDPADKTVFMIGAGGAARAVATTMVLAGAKEIVVANRSFGRAEDLATSLNSIKPGIAKALPLGSKAVTEALGKAQVVVQATSVGMAPNHHADPPIPVEAINPYSLVCDLVYTPAQTRLLQEALARGCRTIGGIGMLVYQGAEAFQLWTGTEAPVELMKGILEKALCIN